MTETAGGDTSSKKEPTSDEIYGALRDLCAALRMIQEKPFRYPKLVQNAVKRFTPEIQDAVFDRAVYPEKYAGQVTQSGEDEESNFEHPTRDGFFGCDGRTSKPK